MMSCFLVEHGFTVKQNYGQFQYKKIIIINEKRRSVVNNVVKYHDSKQQSCVYRPSVLYQTPFELLKNKKK